MRALMLLLCCCRAAAVLISYAAHYVVSVRADTWLGAASMPASCCCAHALTMLLLWPREAATWRATQTTRAHVSQHYRALVVVVPGGDQPHQAATRAAGYG